MEQEAEHESGSLFKVAEGVWGLKDIFVNVYFISNPGDNSWVLLDAGLKSTYPKIKKAAAELFGPDAAPSAIVLTHGHFDHVGALEKLLADWDVPVYAHLLEMPYLTGKSAYPPADPTVGGGLMALFSDLYPNSPIDLSGLVKSLPFSQEIQVLPEWQYYHTPGHAPGHISLWRASDKVLLAGDAFVTTKQESAISVLLQTKVLSGPPSYFTYDWDQAEKSVHTLAGLSPEVVATGHGKPMSGKVMQQQLLELAYYFEEKAVPKHGRYISTPAVTNKYGVVSLPDGIRNYYRALVVVGGIAAVAGLTYALASRRKMRGGLLG